MENYMENNNVAIGGVIISEPEFSHEIFEEKFYKFSIKSKRLSNYEDILPVIISERLVDINKIQVDKIVKINGQFRSYNMQGEKKNKLVLSVFVKEIEFLEDNTIVTLNNANLIGYICKEPVYYYTRQKFDFRQYMNNGGQQND